MTYIRYRKPFLFRGCSSDVFLINMARSLRTGRRWWMLPVHCAHQAYWTGRSGLLSGSSHSQIVQLNRWTAMVVRASHAVAQDTTPVKQLSKVLVANRGEIACRLMQTIKRMGMKTVAVYSDVDVKSLHVRLADEAVCLGPAPPLKSYLNIDAVMAAVRETKADAVHPGYGFLSENAGFVERLEEAGVVFVGPTASAISAMGDKIRSKQLAMDAGVNTIPGCQDVITDEDHAANVAAAIGYPVMLKASAGGGGKGMRIAWTEVEARQSFQLCQAEASSSFGDGRIFIEKFIEDPRHIEIQILGDAHGNVVYLPERECSVQRRNQKVIEEAPSVVLDVATRAAMGQQAVALAKVVNYRSSGTVEFLVDKHLKFYFLEMNTRLQVEHPVTECVTGLDLVELMLKVAAGEKLLLSQERASEIKGWAVESRVYAEDPNRGFLPGNGRLRTYVEPSAQEANEFVRVDSGVEEGSEISIFYDPLISKVTTWGPNRDSALATMETALDRYVVRGLTHNIPFLRSVISHPEFVAGNITTKFLQQHYPHGWKPSEISDDQKEELLCLLVLLHITRYYNLVVANDVPRPKELVITLGGQDHLIKLIGESQQSPGALSLELLLGSAVKKVTLVTSKPWAIEAVMDGKVVTCQVLRRLPRGFQILFCGMEMEVLVQSVLEAALQVHMPPPQEEDFSKVLRSPMPGSLISVSVIAGQQVVPGDELAVIEAMKMRNVLRAENEAVVKTVCKLPGVTLAADDVILEYE